MPICWITDSLGTAPANEVPASADLAVVDVRDLVDKAGNRVEAVRAKLDAAVKHLRQERKTVICCDYGISRSNAIAAGVLALHEGVPFAEAVRAVERKTQAEIKLEPLDVVRRALDPDRKAKPLGDKPTLLVTGSTGFIGQAFCNALRAEFHLVTPSRDELGLETGTVQLGLLVEEHDVDCVLHLANPRVYTSNQALGSTLTMLRNVLEVCAFRGLRLVYPSGWEVYSGYAGTVVASEALPRFPSGPYGETKYLAELMVDHWRATRGLKCAVVRSSPVYGPGAQRPKFIYNFIEKIRRSEKIVTHRYLNGAPALDLLYVDDLIDALARVCRRELVGDLNVGTQCLTATSLVAEMLRAEMGGASSIEETQIESHVACISMNYSKAADVLGWAPRVTLRDGLRAVLQHLHGSAA